MDPETTTMHESRPGLLAFFVSLIAVIIGVCLFLALVVGVGFGAAWLWMTVRDALSLALSGLGVTL